MRTKLNKIKIFKDSSISKLEKTINAWFEKNKYIEIVRILQSETVINNSPDDKNGNFSRTITICYKELEEPPSVAIAESADFSKEQLDSSIQA